MIKNKIQEKIEKVLYCPHHPDGIVPKYTQKCLCRKPNTKLVEEIIKKERFNVSEMALIGDKNTDIETGLKLGLTTYLVLTGYGREYQDVTKAHYIKPDLLSAVKHLLNNRPRKTLDYLTPNEVFNNIKTNRDLCTY